MTRRNISFAWAIPISAYIFIICCRMAAAQGAPPPAVTVAPVISRQVTETGDFIGRVVAIDKVDIVARVSGFIKERNFTEGQQVKAGDLLFHIEPDIYKATVDQQSANVARAIRTSRNLPWTNGQPTNKRHKPMCCKHRPCSNRQRSISATPKSVRQSMDGSAWRISL